jgi:hypothetical protein
MKNLIVAFVISLMFFSCTKDGDSSSSSQVSQESFSPNCLIVYDQPGTYTLAEDITSDTCGIEVKASNVTIDLNGHKIQGPNDLHAVNYGIVGVERSNVKIKNGSIDGFAFGVALTSENGIGNTVKDNEVSHMQISHSSLRGIQIHGYNGKADSNKVTDSGGSLYSPDAFGFGIEMFGPDCLVSNNEVVDTYGSFTPGLVIGEAVAISFSFYNTNCVADHNEIYNNRIVTNKSTFGFWVDVYSAVTLQNNDIHGMHYSGIVPPRTVQISNTTDIPIANGIYDRP